MDSQKRRYAPFRLPVICDVMCNKNEGKND